MPKAEATQEDLDQNKVITQDSKKLDELEKRIAALEKAKAPDFDLRIKSLERDVGILVPLKEIIGHVTQIKRYFGFGGT